MTDQPVDNKPVLICTIHFDLDGKAVGFMFEAASPNSTEGRGAAAVAAYKLGVASKDREFRIPGLMP